VNLHAEELDLSDQPLHLINELGIPLHRSHLRVPPVAEGMRSRAGQHHIAGVGHPLELSDCRPQVLLGLGDRAADAGGELERGLHQLVADLGSLAGLAELGQRREHLGRLLTQRSRPGVDQLQLPLHAQRCPAGWIPVDGHPVLHPSSVQDP
jgi:hypothetical protein